MEHYNFLADLLNKYSQLTPWVQALVSLGGYAVILGAFYFLKEMVVGLVQPLHKKVGVELHKQPEKEWRDKYYRDVEHLS